MRPDDATIRAALPEFVGLISQTPPKFSAVKINGERAHTIARRGDADHLELDSRDLFVETLDFSERLSADEIALKLRGDKGGYVRSIVHDLGEKLGCLAHVKWLRRLDTVPFDISQSITPDTLTALKNMPNVRPFCYPSSLALSSWNMWKYPNRPPTTFNTARAYP